MSEKYHSRRHRITIQRKIHRQNSCGEVLFDWQAVCQTWAQICGDVVTIRFQSDLQPGYRVVIGDDLFKITAVIDRKFRRGRLVELHIENTERERVFLPRFGDEQQRLGLSPNQRLTQATGKLKR